MRLIEIEFASSKLSSAGFYIGGMPQHDEGGSAAAKGPPVRWLGLKIKAERANADHAPGQPRVRARETPGCRIVGWQGYCRDSTRSAATKDPSSEFSA